MDEGRQVLLKKTIVAYNKKGGVAKTTSIVTLASVMARAGYKVLVIDFDPQGNATWAFRVTNPDEAFMNGLNDINNVLFDTPDLRPGHWGEERKRVSYRDAVLTKVDGDFTIDILPNYGNIDDPSTFWGEKGLGKEDYYRLKYLIKNELMFEYNYIFIDMNPSKSQFTNMCLTAADEAIIPITPDVFSIQGINRLMNDILMVNGEYLDADRCISTNPDLIIKAVLLTRVKKTKMCETVQQTLRTNPELMPLAMQNVIRDETAIVEAALVGESIFNYKPKSHTGSDYIKVAYELELITRSEYNQLITKYPEN